MPTAPITEGNWISQEEETVPEPQRTQRQQTEGHQSNWVLMRAHV